jgi:hypothetical protein
VAQLNCIRHLPWFAGLLAFAVIGCHHAVLDPNRPPPNPEEFKLPPAEDARFSKPVQYPKNLLNSDILQSRMAKKDTNKGPGIPKGGAGGMGQ